jgi:MFS family permease
MSVPGRIVGFFSLNRSITAMLVMVILLGMGEYMAERFLPIYLLALGGGAYLAGLLNGMDNLLSALYSFPGGYLSDRLGMKRALLLFNLIAMTGYALVILIPNPYVVFAGAALFLSWSAISFPAVMSLVSKALPKDRRTTGVTLHSLTRRIPMALGPILCGLFIGLWGDKDGVRAAFIAAFALAAFATVLQQIWIIEEDPEKRRAERAKAEKNPFKLWKYMSPELKSLLASDILIRFSEQIPYAYLAIWCTKTLSEYGGTNLSAEQFGLLSAIEMVVAMLVYIPVAYYADRTRKKPFVAVTFVFFTAFPIALYFSRSFWILVVAFVIRGLKEFGEPTRKALIMDLAPEDRKAGTFGLYYLVRDVVVSVAAFASALLWTWGPEWNLFTAFGFGVAGTLLFIFRGRDLTSVKPGAAI